MVYRLTSGSRVIAAVQDTYNVDESDWLQRAANWINVCLSDLGVISEYKVKTETITADEYLVELPCEIKSLEAIEIDGLRVYRSNQLRDERNDENHIPYEEISYTVQGDNYIQLESSNEYYKDVEVTVHFKSFPTEVFKPYNILIPLVPDNEIVIEAIAAYIMIKILGRGYKSNVFTLNSNNIAINPYLQYYGITGKDGLRKKARLKIKGMDKDARERVSVSTRSFNHPDRHFTKDFNNKF